MKIGILEAGDILPEASDPHADYAPMFHDFLSQIDPSIQTDGYAIYKGEFPENVQSADGWLISGSKHGVYEPHDWMPAAETFVRNCVAANIPVVGICFGHQLIAKALGGEVIKSPKGWGTGVNTYDVTPKADWLPDMQQTSVRALHQDQVIKQPPESTVFASSEFCEFAGLYYGDAERPKAMSLQPHPEFSRDYLETVLKVRTGEVIPQEDGQKGIKSLVQPVDNADWARAIVEYFKTSRAQ